MRSIVIQRPSIDRQSYYVGDDVGLPQTRAGSTVAEGLRSRAWYIMLTHSPIPMAATEAQPIGMAFECRVFRL